MTNERTWFPLTGPTSPPSRWAMAAPAKKGPIDPLTGPKQALAGRVITMNDTFEEIGDGVVYIEKGIVVAALDRALPAPPDFASVPVVETGGMIFPGLIELHNHLSYNALPPWAPVPKRFIHRGQWPNHQDYRPLVSGPMTVLGKYKNAQGQHPYLPALVRYVECKCMLGGVTTSQGIRLSSNAGVQRYYRGIVRNVEQTDDPALPEAQGRIPDVVAKDARAFLSRLEKEDSCYLLHLSEGITDIAHPLSAPRKHFLALEVAPDRWALNKVFAGIHAAGLLPADFDVLARYSASMVWSPLSNLLLYGDTARVAAAKAAGVPIGLGSDWSPTGSKNLLGELKVAWLFSQAMLNGQFSTRDIVAMATRDAAKILKWDKVVGTINAGKRADLIVLNSNAADPYDALLHAAETDIHLVMINGVARCGVPGLMKPLAPKDESVRVGGQMRKLYLKQETADPDVARVSLGDAAETLRDGLTNLVKLAKAIEKAEAKAPAKRPVDAPVPPVWTLALDEISPCGVDLGPRLPFNGPRDFTGPDRIPRAIAKAGPPLSQILKPISLDPLTVADDDTFLDMINGQPNVPASIRINLRTLY